MVLFFQNVTYSYLEYTKIKAMYTRKMAKYYEQDGFQQPVMMQTATGKVDTILHHQRNFKILDYNLF